MKTSAQIQLSNTIDEIKSELGNSSDLVLRKFTVKIGPMSFQTAILFLSSLADSDSTENLCCAVKNVSPARLPDNPAISKNGLAKLKTSLVYNMQVEEGSEREELYRQLMNGSSIILAEGSTDFLYCDTYNPPGRSISEPNAQTVIRGSKEAFTEKIQLNISMIRRRIKNKSMRIINLTMGSVTHTDVAVVYMNNIVKQPILDELLRRLKKIKIDSILEGSYIEQLAKDDPYSLFPTFLNSERPDAVAAALLEGKIAIVVDGTPFVLIVPALFVDFMQASEDYYHHFIIASAIRFIRCIAFFLTLLVPAIYIALSTFHHEMIPTQLLISMAAQQEGVPFPAFVEAVLMEITFEILREAGVRMPRAVGSAISIVGALVLGQAAVQAGLISAVIVIIVSVTAIASFAIPNYSMTNAIGLLRFGFMVLAASFGLYGIYIGLITLTVHLCKIKSIGVPYLTPLAPKVAHPGQDTFFRFPLWKMQFRPQASSKLKSPRIPMTKPVQSKTKQDREPLN